MPLRILHALHTVDPKASGLTEDVLLLSAVHRRLRHRVEILAFDAPGTAWLGELGVPVHRMACGRPGRVDTRRFLQWLREHAAGYDCVLVSGIAGCNAFRTWRVLRDGGAPYFVFAPEYLGGLSGLARQLSKWRQRLYWPWAGALLFRDALAVFFSSEEARREARACFWPYDCHEFTLACGAAGPPAGGGLAAGFLTEHPELDGKRIFTVWADEEHAVPEFLLGAVSVMIDAGRWDRGSMRLLVAGGAEGARAGVWRRAVDGHGLVGVVDLIDTPCGVARFGMLHASEVLVQSARAANPRLMAAEAFAAGTPVLIARGVNPWREIVGHGAGFAGDDTDEGYLELLSRWLGQSPEDRAAMRTGARQAFETHHGEEAAANTLAAVIYLLIGASQSDKEAPPEIFKHEVDFL